MNEVPLEGFAANEPNSFVDGPFGSDLKVSDYSESGVRILQLQNVGDGYFIGDNVKFTTERKALELNRCVVRPGDLLIAKMADPLARACVVPPEIERGLIVADLMKLRLAHQHNATYVCAAINSPTFRREAERLSTGTTRTRISLSTLKRICLPERTPKEEERIGTIARIVDEVIEQTEALIAKQQQVKAGLMHDLFTRGLTPNGQLRPTRAEAPDLYHETPLGWLPRVWRPVTISSIGDVVTGNTPDESSLQSGGRGIPFITPGDVTGDVFVDATARSAVRRDVGRARPIPAGSICVVCIGSTIGKLAMTRRESITNQQINSVVSAQPELAAFYYLSAGQFLPAQLRREAGLQAVPIVNKSTFSRMLVAVPPKPTEAAEIQSRMLSAAAALAAEADYLSKLRQLKQGLMQALLTPPS